MLILYSFFFFQNYQKQLWLLTAANLKWRDIGLFIIYQCMVIFRKVLWPTLWTDVQWAFLCNLFKQRWNKVSWHTESQMSASACRSASPTFAKELRIEAIVSPDYSSHGPFDSILYKHFSTPRCSELIFSHLATSYSIYLFVFTECCVVFSGLFSRGIYWESHQKDILIL